MNEEYKDSDIRIIPKDWQYKKLNEIALVKMGQSPPSATYNNQGLGLPFYQGNKDFGLKYPNKTIFCSEPKKIAERGEVLFSVRAPIGDINIAIEKSCIGRGLSSISMRNGNNDFLYYLLKFNSNKIKSFFETDGTVFGCLTKDGLNNFDILVPENIIEQKAIAKVLSDLDDKIELNNEINKTLEEIGQALFKRWFINFEFPDENGNPYRSSGGEMVYSKELDKEIPKGWEVKRLKELAKLEMGISPRGSSYNSIGEGLPLLNGAADFDGKSIKPNKYTSSPTKTCKENDIIFCIRGTIGNLTFSDSIYCIGRGVSAISPCKDEYREFIFLYLNQYLDKLIKNAFGSVILGLSKEDIRSLLITLPSENTIKLFHNIVLRLNNLLKNNNTQSKTLSELRDSLLPKLMSGEIRVLLEASQ